MPHEGIANRLMLSSTPRDDPMDGAPCPLCGTGVRSAATAGPRCFRHCAVCDLIHVPAGRHPSIAAQRARYLLHENDRNSAGYVRRLAAVADLAMGFHPEARRVLDFGSGPEPVLVQMLRDRGMDAAGYDPIFAPRTDLSRPYDAVLSIETFEHFGRPADDVARAAGLVAPGGILAIMTLWHDGVESIGSWWYARDVTHVAFYSPRTIGWISRRHGLCLEYVDSKNLAILRRPGGRASPGPEPDR